MAQRPRRVRGRRPGGGSPFNLDLAVLGAFAASVISFETTFQGFRAFYGAGAGTDADASLVNIVPPFIISLVVQAGIFSASLYLSNAFVESRAQSGQGPKEQSIRRSLTGLVATVLILIAPFSIFFSYGTLYNRLLAAEAREQSRVDGVRVDTNSFLRRTIAVVDGRSAALAQEVRAAPGYREWADSLRLMAREVIGAEDEIEAYFVRRSDEIAVALEEARAADVATQAQRLRLQEQADRLVAEITSAEIELQRLRERQTADTEFLQAFARAEDLEAAEFERLAFGTPQDVLTLDERASIARYADRNDRGYPEPPEDASASERVRWLEVELRLEADGLDGRRAGIGPRWRERDAERAQLAAQVERRNADIDAQLERVAQLQSDQEAFMAQAEELGVEIEAEQEFVERPPRVVTTFGEARGLAADLEQQISILETRMTGDILDEADFLCRSIRASLEGASQEAPSFGDAVEAVTCEPPGSISTPLGVLRDFDELARGFRAPSEDLNCVSASTTFDAVALKARLRSEQPDLGSAAVDGAVVLAADDAVTALLTQAADCATAAAGFAAGPILLSDASAFSGGDGPAEVRTDFVDGGQILDGVQTDIGQSRRNNGGGADYLTRISGFLLQGDRSAVLAMALAIMIDSLVLVLAFFSALSRATKAEGADGKRSEGLTPSESAELSTLAQAAARARSEEALPFRDVELNAIWDPAASAFRLDLPEYEPESARALLRTVQNYLEPPLGWQEQTRRRGALGRVFLTRRGKLELLRGAADVVLSPTAGDPGSRAVDPGGARHAASPSAGGREAPGYGAADDDEEAIRQAEEIRRMRGR